MKNIINESMTIISIVKRLCVVEFLLFILLLLLNNNVVEINGQRPLSANISITTPTTTAATTTALSAAINIQQKQQSLYNQQNLLLHLKSTTIKPSVRGISGGGGGFNTGTSNTGSGSYGGHNGYAVHGSHIGYGVQGLAGNLSINHNNGGQINLAGVPKTILGSVNGAQFNTKLLSSKFQDLGSRTNISYRGRKNTFKDLRKTVAENTRLLLERQRDDPSGYEVNDSMATLKQSYKSDRAIIIQEETALDILGVTCNFEVDCAWTWDQANDTFQVISGANLTELNQTGMYPGPATDPRNDANGHFLYLRLLPKRNQRFLRSLAFSATRDRCYLEMFVHQSSMINGSIRIVIEPQNEHESSWVPTEMAGNDMRQWQLMHFRIGRISQDFQIILEIVPPVQPVDSKTPLLRGHIAIDDISLKGCFTEGDDETCESAQVKCLKSKREICLTTFKVCDIDVDCDDKEDELLNCEKIPFGGRCDFETDDCGWHNSGKAIMDWVRFSGPTPTDKTGPDTDHTYQNTNITGHYMFVNMNQHADKPEIKKLVGFASNAVMNSVIFNPPPSAHFNLSSPYYRSCIARFYCHQFGPNVGSINMSVVEIKGKENITTTMWWSSKNLGEEWLRQNVVLPNITSKYFLQFEARMGMRIFSDVAIDDFSLSPECFGLNIPIDQLDGYNYWDPRLISNKQPHRDFINRTIIELSTCGARGKEGPRSEQCKKAYNETYMGRSVRVIDVAPFRGIQTWRAPSEGYYTIIAKGAGGGLGSGGIGSSRGALAISVLELHRDEEIHMLIGQRGEHACIKSMGYRNKECEPKDTGKNGMVISEKGRNSKTKLVKNMVIEDGAGGGGGATFVFLLNPSNIAVPLVVAGGGGGLGIGRYLDDHDQHGRLFNPNGTNISGQMLGDINKTGGSGGGWHPIEDVALVSHSGASLIEGARGGEPCYVPRGIHGQGGFGGGGGGCHTGGGGGGYSGGDAMADKTNGDGGTSYISMSRSVAELSAVYEGDNSGPGSVVIIPAISTPACGCDYRCVALDEFSATVACICPDNWRLKKDNLTACEPIHRREAYPLNFLIIFFGIISIMLVTALGGLIFILYNRYQRKKQAALRHKMLLEQDLQLSRLRNTADDSALTNFNPNYGCDGILNGNVDVKSLPQVARESLRLLKALGQGAFGEVYQGLYRHRDGDAVEMPVAVKTLPEMSTGQAEADFLMEAAIMAKFNHPNIVHLIGVCFDRHPRFIVLELLAGGDLKNFLREGRNKPERPSPLTMKDLVFCALDVAKGCRYMESKRFIHRDIAARNCLLSSKGPGRVVKIADFGMARDIYRSDYYRKGGKAMLPIKWMPPEAFLDGIFTSKTDVWSFGVLLWEVFSLGLMPYTGLPNRDVMQLVTGGGRLDAPPGCPPAIYRIMAECWNPTPEERPSFSNLLERLSTCTQDPEVMNAPLPSLFRPPSTERDQTIMRPPNDDFCLQVPNSSDYLIPLPGPRSAAERLLSEATGVTLSESVITSAMPRMTTPPTTKQQHHHHHNNNSADCWETSFMMPNSRSDQLLLSGPDQQLQQQQQQHQHHQHNHNHNHHHNQLNTRMHLEHNNDHHNGSMGGIGVGGSVGSGGGVGVSVGCGVDDDDEDKLISLDTPQQTPTTIKPPISFGDKESPTTTTAAANVMSCNTMTIPTAITLDPSNLPGVVVSSVSKQNIGNNGLSYANVQMCNHPIVSSKLTNGIDSQLHHQPQQQQQLQQHNAQSCVDKSSLPLLNGTINLDNSIAPPPQPFTIQGFNDRYKSNENHSEISC